MSRILATVPLVGWLVGFLFRVVFRWFFGPVEPRLLIPLVSLPGSEAGDVVSDIRWLVVAAGWSLLAVLLVEAAKVVLVRRNQVHGTLVYVLLVAYQVILFVDLLRANAFDWWLWVLSLAGVYELRLVGNLDEIAGFRIPWISGVVALMTTAALFYIQPRLTRVR